jgi:hypothetical protein
MTTSILFRNVPAETRAKMFREMSHFFKMDPKDFAEMLLATSRVERQKMLQRVSDGYGVSFILRRLHIILSCTVSGEEVWNQSTIVSRKW